MPGHLQEGFSCVVTNRFDQEQEKRNQQGWCWGLRGQERGSSPSQTHSNATSKQLRKELQKDRKNPLAPNVSVADKEEETQVPVVLKKEGIRQVGRRPDQQIQGEGKITDRKPERRFEKPLEKKGEGDYGGLGRGRGGRGHGMGRGDGYGFGSHGKREFDRYSGSDRSGLKHEDKHGGSGSHNLGTVKFEFTDLDQSNVTEETREGEEHPVANTENMENEVEEKAIQNKDRAKVEFNIRKANEGADGQWKKGFVLHISKSAEAHAEDSVMDHHFWKPANDITSQLEINFGDLGCPGRDGGRGRSGRPNHGSRTDKSSASAPDMDNPEAFPALA
uniref:Hyaluronan/mRNA-binding protein domain-containing protein n=1 Tax=Jaculus jaculus TaxID=51337 RepID=A0A8C5KNZ6_JACJA